MGQSEQANHGPTCGACIALCEQPFPRRPVRRAGEQRVAIDKVQQRHRLAAQAVDDVAVIDNLDTPTVRWRTAAR